MQLSELAIQCTKTSVLLPPPAPVQKWTTTSVEPGSGALSEVFSLPHWHLLEVHLLEVFISYEKKTSRQSHFRWSSASIRTNCLDFFSYSYLQIPLYIYYIG